MDWKLTGLIRMLGDDLSGVRRMAAQALAWWGPLAASAVPDLIVLSKDRSPDVRQAAAEALGTIRDVSAIPVLTKLLDDAASGVILASAWALGKFRLAAAPAVPALMALAQVGGPGERQAAVKALGSIGNEFCIVALMKALEDRAEAVRQAAAEALGWIGRAASSAVPALTAARNDQSEIVRREVARSLELIQG